MSGSVDESEAAGEGLAWPVFVAGDVCPKPKAQITISSSGCAGLFTVTSVPSACVTRGPQYPESDVTLTGGKPPQILMTCRLSGTGERVNALLMFPLSLITKTGVLGGIGTLGGGPIQIGRASCRGRV